MSESAILEQPIIERALTTEDIDAIRKEGGIEDIVLEGPEFEVPKPEELDLNYFKDFEAYPDEIRAYIEQVYRILRHPFFVDKFGDDHVRRMEWIDEMKKIYGLSALKYLKDNRLTINKLYAFTGLFDAIVYRGARHGYSASTDDRMRRMVAFKERLNKLYENYNHQPYEERIAYVIEATKVGIEFLKMLKK